MAIRVECICYLIYSEKFEQMEEGERSFSYFRLSSYHNNDPNHLILYSRWK